MNHVAIILAAGESKRLGQPKQLLKHRGQTLLAHSVDRARQAGSDDVIVVAGANFDEIRHTVKGLQCRLLDHADWNHGIGSSLAFGVRFALSHGQAERAILVLLCDQPFIPVTHLEQLVAAVKAHDVIGATKYPDHSAGIPACFPARYGDALSLCTGHSGAKTLIESEAAQLIDCPEAEHDIDVADDLKLLDP